MLRRLAVAVLAVTLVLPIAAGAAGGAGGRAAEEGGAPGATGGTRAAHGARAFGELIDGIGRTMLARSPETATDLGLSEELGLDDSELDDRSHEYRAETAALARESLAELASVDPAALAPDERLALAVTEWYLQDIVTMHELADHEYAVNFITGAHVNLPEFLADVHPLDDLEDAQAFVARLAASGTQMAQVADQLRRGEAAGNLPTERGLWIAARQLGSQTLPATNHPIRTDLAERLEGLDLDEAETERIMAAAEEALERELVPAYKELQSAVGAAATRSDATPGVLHHVDGADYYAVVLAHHLSVPLTPGEVHELGLAEVERLTGELTERMSALGVPVDELGFAEAIAAVSATAPVVPLRSDEDREALLASTEAFIADSSAAFADMFSTRPDAPLVVRRPRPGREGAGGAYYRPPPTTADRPGIYYLGLAGNAFPTDTYATTNYHEAIPGHHFQLALQRESENLPLLQRATVFTGYAEGWGLYAERLAAEAGLYADDPIGDFGRLRMELLRAARAVADTGIHALGWSRDEAVGYLVDLGLPDGWATSEVDRYIVWPGQAPAYLIGMLEILRLREAAQAQLGQDFDLAGFHDAVLRHGSVPLAVLPMAVEAWIASVG